MSLESQVADLVTASNALIATFSGKNAEINKAVAAAIAAIPSNEKSFYINSITGDDKNPGTAAAPLKTLKQALYNTPSGGTVVCNLQTDYLLDTNVAVSNRVMHICSDVFGVKRKLRCAYYLTNDAASTWLGGFVMYYGGQTLFTDITLELPTPSGLAPVPYGLKNAVFMANSSAGTPLVQVKLSSCDVVAAADWTGWLIAASNSAIVLEIFNSTFPANFGGRYVNGVPAGTNPASLANLLTNLATL